MAYAVINSDGSLKCIMGSQSEDTIANIASGIELENNTASTIFDAPKMPDFGKCIIWSTVTLGTSTDCIPAIVPLYIIGIIGVEWAGFPANCDDDMAMCIIGGVISIDDAGTEIEIA